MAFCQNFDGVKKQQVDREPDDCRHVHKSTNLNWRRNFTLHNIPFNDSVDSAMFKTSWRHRTAVMASYEQPDDLQELDSQIEDCNRETWIVIGDSNVNRFKHYLEKPEKVQLIVVPMPGAKVVDLRGRIGWVVKNAKRRLVKIVLHVGVNDIKPRWDCHHEILQKFHQLFDEICEASGEKTVMVFVCTVPPKENSGMVAISQSELVNKSMRNPEWSTSCAKVINLLPYCTGSWSRDGVHYASYTAKQVAKSINWNLAHYDFVNV